ncbi:MAG TPA: efflux RND transporter periplasmic adaptor subunit [Polyangiaceae bacterium]|nr:efflux RND transporter periplasmic adaptor subunit [Polyangiaceae bacterium]
MAATILRIALVCTLATLGCQRSQVNQERSAAAVPVSVQPVVRADVPVEIRAIGTVEAVSTVAIVPQVTGRVTSIHFAEGAAVRKNDPLFSIDTRPYNATLAAAQADLQKNRALAEEAEVEAQRYQALVREGLATMQEAARREADKKSTAASVEAAEAQIASASLNVQFSTVRSPIDGRTGRVLVHAGNVVRAGDTEPMVVVRSLTPVKVVFTISQDLLPRLRERFKGTALPVRATPRGGGARTSVGELSFIDNTVDAATGMLTLKATFPNQDEALWPGAFVDVVLVLDEERGAIVAPEAAVGEGQQGPYAFVIDAENKARLRRVTLKRRTEAQAIVASGLVPGDRVVVDGLVRLKEGTPVSVKADTPIKAESVPTGGSGS